MYVFSVLTERVPMVLVGHPVANLTTGQPIKTFETLSASTVSTILFFRFDTAWIGGD